MILIRREKIVIYVKHYQNLFVLNFIKLEKAIAIGHRISIYIVNKNK